MPAVLTLVRKLINELEDSEILKKISPQITYPDEPKMFNFSAILGISPKYTDGKTFKVNGSGFSFNSRELALLKCLMESIERFSNMCYRGRDVEYDLYDNILRKAINPLIYLSKNLTDHKAIGWIEGRDLINNETTLIPAQVVFYNYKFRKGEPLITQLNSTGAAGGLDFESTILRGIYEVVERDAFMTVYLTKNKAPKINLNYLKSLKIKKIVDNILRFNLEIMVFDIANDLKIPSFLTILIDKTGLGPALSLGLKSSLSPEDAILGSIEESLHSRPWMKSELWNRQTRNFHIQHDKIISLLDRGLFWLSPHMLKNMDFLIDQPAINKKFKRIKLSSRQELEEIKKLFKKNQIDIYYRDIGLERFKNLGLYFYKVIIPSLQPLFLHENQREVRLDRIRKVADFFGQKNLKINRLPHPFL